MKKIIILMLSSTICFIGNLNAQGIVFTQGTYEQIKDKAAHENKKIFVDVYTSWCGPCKQMSEKVFPDSRVGEFFNSHFVSVKLDAEKEASHGFFQQYKASAYPTYFWLDADGTLLDKKIGVRSAEDFIEVAREAMYSNLALEHEKLRQRWESGERNLELLKQYVFGVLGSNQPQLVRPALIDYLVGLDEEDLKSYPVYQIILSNLGVGNRTGFIDDMVFDIFLRNFDYYRDQYATVYDTEIQSLYSVLYRHAVRFNTAPMKRDPDPAIDDTFENQMRILRSNGIKYAEIFELCARAEKELYRKNYKSGIQAIIDILGQYGKDFPYLYEQLLYSLVYSGYFIEQEKKPMEKEVMQIMTDAMKIIPNKAIVTYYAAANAALGNYREAISALANKHFYSGQDISNAIYPFMNMDNIRSKFPEKDFPKPKSKQLQTSLGR